MQQFSNLDRSEVVLEADFINDVREERLYFENLLNNRPQNLRFGPQYSITTSHGLPLIIHTCFMSGVDSQVFLAEDESTSILVGMRELIFLDSEKDVDFRTGRALPSPNDAYRDIPALLRIMQTENTPVESNVITGIRGMGIASALELAVHDLLQRYVDFGGIPATWKVSNHNLRNLQALMCSEAFPRQKLRELIGEKTTEQERWQAIWGDNGSFGFKNGIKHFSPRASTIDPETIDMIALAMERDSSGRTTGGRIMEESYTTPDSFPQCRMQKARRMAELFRSV